MKDYSTHGLGASPSKAPKKKKHSFRVTHIHHHDDGTHSMHHDHEDGSVQSHALPDLDGVHDNIEEHLGEPNSDEDQIEEKIHPGIHAQVLKQMP